MLYLIYYLLQQPRKCTTYHVIIAHIQIIEISIIQFFFLAQLFICLGVSLFKLACDFFLFQNKFVSPGITTRLVP